MEIRTYDEVDPTQVLALNLASLDYPLTPETAAQIRRLDPRPFPFLALYAVEDEIVAGQVGVFRLPVASTQGPVEIGGVWAVCTHPAFERRGVASALLEEAHARMRAAGLLFSSLGTARHRGAHALYRRHGYEDVFTPTTCFARRTEVSLSSSLRAGSATLEQLALADELFHRGAAGRLGFARRHPGFFAMLVAIGDVSPAEVRLLWLGQEPVGYAVAQIKDTVLKVRSLSLLEGVEPAQAVAALAQDPAIGALWVRADEPSVAESLRRAGYPQGQPAWATFMLKTLDPAVSLADARQLLGLGTVRFMISALDVT